MILDFTVGNFRSFYAKKSLILQAQRLGEDVKNKVDPRVSHDILKTLAIYGANSSGKSNLIDALYTMSLCVLTSVKLNENDTLPYDPFLLSKETAVPTLFEITFLKNDFCYRYGFKYSSSTIEDEWLFRRTTPRSKEQFLFIRDRKGVTINGQQFSEGSGFENKINKNRLFLSLCAQLRGTISNQVISWFQDDFNVISGLNNGAYRDFSTKLFHEKKESAENALKFFKILQLGFENLQTRESEFTVPDKLPEKLKVLLQKELLGRKKIEVYSIHQIYDNEGNVCDTTLFPFDKNESAGTIKLFDLSGPLFDTLFRGSVLVIDELDAKMHPLISQHIIRLFHNPSTNLHNAQLIFTTHDTHLLSTKMLRRDQIWFTEKDHNEQTDLYCLTDIVLPNGNKLRNDANYEENYIAGRYGAVPYILNE